MLDRFLTTSTWQWTLTLVFYLEVCASMAHWGILSEEKNWPESGFGIYLPGIPFVVNWEQARHGPVE